MSEIIDQGERGQQLRRDLEHKLSAETGNNGILGGKR